MSIQAHFTRRRPIPSRPRSYNRCRRKYASLFLGVVIVFLAISLPASATTYFVRVNGGSGGGTSDVLAWNYARLNAAVLHKGDLVLFRRGDTFFGPLTAADGVRYGAYGRGKDPVITGLRQVGEWTRYSGNIYVTTIGAVNPALVLLNGKPVGAGRYPNAGYLSYTGHKGKTVIEGAAIKDLPFNATGGEVVVRKERWILDRHVITAHRGSALTLSLVSPDGGNNNRPGVDGNGFFIQNLLATLDRPGEWCYNKEEGKLYMVLPAGGRVSFSAVDNLLPLNGKKDISFSNIDFTGSNRSAVSVQNASGISFLNCGFRLHGQNGIYGLNTTKLLVKNSRVSDCLNNGIWVEWDGRGTTIENTVVRNCGLIAGAGRSGDSAQEGISIGGNGTTVKACKLTRTGYNGIHFNGSNAVIEGNKVDSFCLVKDDGGGIYTFEGDGANVTNRVIRNNTVLNAIGAFGGAESYTYEAFGKAAGIYLDGASSETDVTGNIIGNGPWAGFFVNNNSGNRFTGNVVFGHYMSVYLLESGAGRIRKLTMKGNHLLGERALVVKMYAADNPALLGDFTNNRYPKGKKIWVIREHPGGGTQQLNLAQWKRLGLDSGSIERDEQ